MKELYERYPELLPCKAGIEKMTEEWIRAFAAGHKLLVCGNGGSAADADHIVGELMKGFLKKRPIGEDVLEKMTELYGREDAERLASRLQGALPAVSLNVHGALLSAFVNDVDAETAFAQGVLGYGNEGDLLLCLSTSGNSKNCVAAAKVAKAKGLTVLSVTGERESKLSALSDLCLRLPAAETYRVQEYTLPVYHALCADTEAYFFSV